MTTSGRKSSPICHRNLRGSPIAPDGVYPGGHPCSGGSACTLGGVAGRLAFQICLIHAVRGLRDSREDLAPSAPGSHCGRNSPARIRTAGMQLAGSSSHALGEAGGRVSTQVKTSTAGPGPVVPYCLFFTLQGQAWETDSRGMGDDVAAVGPAAGVAHGAMPAQPGAPVRNCWRPVRRWYATCAGAPTAAPSTSISPPVTSSWSPACPAAASRPSSGGPCGALDRLPSTSATPAAPCPG
ncbi:hypothetical protein SBADM41S_06355 [Streptomyces badius]